ncbi:class I SAM-dependent methyltransferase [Flavivirga rizhaonensis]|uniref:Class I SAM-dependent methyltransferase n=1 Tax=Flavivirga rizhaonensis TaxID=2559571 RepID=A0A4S1DWG9_9FLAO|nr:class I SAM-dependent methyltransferase [Flavivirga rizhaonensis]TGV02470.1 class I SAM-dependent methyltransferase [Flavivirga rizhaonensis]
MGIVNTLKFKLLKIKPIQYYFLGKAHLNDKFYINEHKKGELEKKKTPSRTEIINYILSLFETKTTYLEIGVRDPDENFNLINADKKYSVDPGIEFEENPVDFALTSDAFFEQLKNGKALSKDIKFDVIFIDGLHLAEQVNKDIENSLKYIKEDGYIVIHDCNPPTEWHARIEHNYRYTPARHNWNGTTWKSFLKWRCNNLVKSCCIDSDWGVGILSKTHAIGESIDKIGEFYDYSELNNNRKEYLNLIDFQEFKNKTEVIHCTK